MLYIVGMKPTSNFADGQAGWTGTFVTTGRRVGLMVSNTQIMFI